MKCNSCGSITSRIIVTLNGEEICHRCGTFSEAAGVKTTGVLTRSSERIRHDSVMYEGDMQPPHIYNKNTKKVEVNPEFIKRYPDHAHEYYTPDTVDAAGLPKLKEHMKKVQQKTASFREKQHQKAIKDTKEA